MEEKDNLVISDSELVQYLEITNKMLSAAKTELDTNRLKDIILILKNGEYKVIHEKAPKRMPQKKDVQSIIPYLEKTHRGEDVSSDEKEIFEEYCKKNFLLKLAINQSYEELYCELSARKDISRDEISVVYCYLTGSKVKNIKIDKMIDDIKQHIYKLKNFNDMDARFSESKEKSY